MQDLIAKIEAAPARSAWSRGVKLTALDMLASVPDGVALTCDSVQQVLLNGARDWREYADWGCGLIYDTDIAARYCTASELRRNRGGDLRPNNRESWLDVEARACREAARMIRRKLS